MTQKIYPAGQVQLTPLTGAELVTIDGGGAVDVFATTQQIANLATLESTSKVITALNTVGAGTVTAAGIVGGITARGGAQSGSAFTDTTDTAAAIIALLPSAAPVGTTFVWTYENTTNAAATLAAGVGVTLAGNVVIPLLTTAEYLVKYTAAGAISITFFRAGSVCPLPLSVVTTQAVTTLSTITPAGLTSSQMATLILTGLATTNATIAVPAAVDIVAAWPNARPGASNQVLIVNNGTSTAQLSGLTGTTISGTSKIQPSKAQSYNLNLDSLASASLTGLTQSQLS